MNPKIIPRRPIILVGMNFFGDPFNKASSWSEDNEIGRLWKRFNLFLENNPESINYRKNTAAFLEVHIINEQINETGEYEVFVGTEVEKIKEIPLECAAKFLPSTEYAVFSISGKEITDMDLWKKVYDEWIPNAGYESSYNYNFQFYGKKCFDLNKIEDAKVDLYFPVRKIKMR